jgi:cytochrome b involved in lipid metabolism
LKFHPGGVEELMKGAGKNSTQLFNDVSLSSFSHFYLTQI